jgi:nitrogen fixation NifU-like protein
MNDVDALYQDVLLEHKRRPRHHGPLPGANHESRGVNPLCGDAITLRLRESEGRIADIAFEGQGCAICIASASMMTEAVCGHRLGEARETLRAMRRMLSGEGTRDDAALGKLELLSGVCRFPSRIKCALLAWHALGECLGDEPGAAVPPPAPEERRDAPRA